MAPPRDGWSESFRRECRIRNGIILHGNTSDILLDPEGSDTWLGVSAAVTAALDRVGYTQIVCWDRVAGVTGVSSRQWRRMERATVSVPQADGLQPIDIGVPAAHTETASPRGPTSSNPQDFLSVVAHEFTDTSGPPSAFILDWTEYLFGQINSLPEAERGWLTYLGKATRDAPVVAAGAASQLHPIVILLCRGLSVLPPSLYVGNPTFAQIRVPLPSRAERERAIEACDLRIEPPPLPNSRVLTDLVDSLDGLSLRDIRNLAELSYFTDDALSAESLVTLYRYGERRSPWESLDREKLRGVEEDLTRRVKGQDSAVAAVNRVLIRAYTGMSGLQHSQRQRTPKGVLFFVGPTGVGKTELAKALAEFLFGDEDACLRFDMSEYNHEHADQRLVGAPPGYVGFEEGGQLTNAVKARPFSVLLFDEIEKAHPRILDKFLQILEDGRLTDGKGETVLFSDTLIVFTSNIGAADVRPDEDDVDGHFKELVRDHFVRELKRPELLGRISESNIVPFNFITDTDNLVLIARTKLGPLRRRLQEKWGIAELAFEDETRALTAIVRQVDTTAGGRGVLNALSELLIDPLADFLFQEVDAPKEGERRSLLVTQFRDHAEFAFELATA